MSATDAAGPTNESRPPGTTSAIVAPGYDMPTVDDLIFEAGVLWERRRAACATAQLDATWVSIGGQEYARKIAQERQRRPDTGEDWPGGLPRPPEYWGTLADHDRYMDDAVREFLQKLPELPDQELADLIVCDVRRVRRVRREGRPA